MELLSLAFSGLKCPSCLQLTLQPSERLSAKKGYASFLLVKCTSSDMCTYEHSFFSSKTTSKDKSFDVNNRIVYAMRNIGQGHSSLEQFSALMDMPRPMTKKTFM